MKAIIKVLAVAIISASTLLSTTTAQAQATRLVYRAGVWVLEAVAQDQVTQHVVYPAANAAFRWAAADPMNNNGGTYANSTQMYRQYQPSQQQYYQPRQQNYYNPPQQQYYAPQQQQQYYAPQQQYYQQPQRRICSNGRQQWYC